MKFKLFFVIDAALCVASCSPYAGLPNDFRRTDAKVIENSNGSVYIDRGSAFGVTIGMDRRRSQYIMLHNKQITVGASSCLPPPEYKTHEAFIYDNDPAIVKCTSRTWVDHYFSYGLFRQGYISVASHNDRVIEIEWGAPAPRLF